ncbi:MAG: FAD-binding protein, partial [Chloroflexota bacterium]
MERMVLSWGRAHRLHHNVIHFDAEQYRQQITRLTDASLNQKILAHGYGRSYGDVALNDGGTLVMTRRLKHLLQADWKTGRIRAAAGLSFDELLQICVPKGWFIPVSPGTKFVTLGGAVANDVHGKNHHKSGSFGAHLYCFQLYRSDRGELICSPDENKD